MAASSDRVPPPLSPLSGPLSASEEPRPAHTDMEDGDSDEGEDIFVSNVRLPLSLINYKVFVRVMCDRQTVLYLI